ncbi:MAG: NAD-dependent epimerase/dehydratase family protein [Thermoleophilaceae bacterium]|nr:NAD-dependent epimerase/dehydratase family protein [Thermoleophilaceae bacterium]
MKVLVTGGAGFIGSHLVDALLAAGEEVRVLDNLDPLAHSGGVAEHLDPGAELVQGDLRDDAAVERALADVDRVFHLGGVVGNGESMVNVRRAVDANSGGTATLLEGVIARRETIRRLVLASSMVVYGEGAYTCPEHGEIAPPPRSLEQLREREWEMRCPHCGREAAAAPTGEDRPLRPTSVYGITKRDQEELCLALGAAYGFEAVALRYLNTYGPRQALANPYTGVAAIFAARILAGRAPRVFEDGRQLRDLVHVSDVVLATLAAMDAPAAQGHALNVATGERTDIATLAGKIANVMGSELEPDITAEYRTGDIRHCFADTSRARELLGFEARVGLDSGLPELAEWLAGQSVSERGDEAVADLRARGLVG